MVTVTFHLVCRLFQATDGVTVQRWCLEKLDGWWVRLSIRQEVAASRQPVKRGQWNGLVMLRAYQNSCDKVSKMTQAQSNAAVRGRLA